MVLPCARDASRGAAGNCNGPMLPVTRRLLLLLLLSFAPGCSLVLPEVSTMPVVHNPFPQLSRVAVAPFVNLSDEPTVDGREFAKAYFAELQATPGFEVVPLGVVEETMIAEGIDLSDPSDARRLATLLGVDAVVVGAVTDYTPYYPPRCGMRVEWYAANPGFHEIPAGYGLPWGTPEEEYIPPEVVFEAELALARAQLATQSPDANQPAEPSAMPPVDAAPMPGAAQPGATDDSPTGEGGASAWRSRTVAGDVVQPAAHATPAPGTTGADVAGGPEVENSLSAPLPPHRPDPRGFVPPGPPPTRPPLVEHQGPVITHTQIFLGHDPEFTAALAAYVDFRDDARFGGWRSYLERSDDFIRFCCHLHISEMLSARGGSSETRVVRRWSNCR